MNQLNYQPKFKLMIGDKNVTNLVDGDVVLSQTESCIVTLEFRLKHGNYFVDAEDFRGAKVQFWGGYTEGQYKKMFVGANTFTFLDLEPSGLSFARCECYSSGYSSKTGENKPRCYPTANSDRVWANCSSIKASELVRQLIIAIGAEVGKITDKNGVEKDGIIITENLDVTFTKKSQAISDGSDWGMLAQLAESMDCALYEEFSDADNGWKIFFVSRSSKTKFTTTPDLVFIGRNAENITWDKDGIMNYVNNERFDPRSVSSKQVQLTNFTVTEDFKVPLSRLQMKFGVDSYDIKDDVWAWYDQKTGTWSYYIFDFDKDTTWRQKNPGMVFNADTMDFGYMKDNFMRKMNYEKGTEMSNKSLPMIARPYPMRRASGSCRGNVLINAQVNYNVYGISDRYSSYEGRKWTMISCKHLWGSNGYSCDFEMFQP